MDIFYAYIVLQTHIYIYTTTTTTIPQGSITILFSLGPYGNEICIFNLRAIFCKSQNRTFLIVWVVNFFICGYVEDNNGN